MTDYGHERAEYEAWPFPATPTDARREYAYNAGAEHYRRQWILTDWDTWERNPHYTGPDQGHPEYDDDMDATYHRTCDPDKDRIAALEASQQAAISVLTSLLALPEGSPWRGELKGVLARLCHAVHQPEPATSCEHCPADGGGCTMCQTD